MREFNWDRRKTDNNRAKHGVSFTAAARAFADPFAVVERDSDLQGEERWRLTGVAEGVKLLLIAYLEWDETDGTDHSDHFSQAGHTVGAQTL